MADSFRITYLGQCCFLVEADGVRIVTDPYLSDCVDRIVPGWKRAYDPPCTLSALSPDYVLISHAHEDHMDLETIARYHAEGGKARFIAPAPTTKPLTQLGCSVLDARAEKSMRLRNVEITPIACAHTQLQTDEAGRFVALSYLMDFGGCCVFFGGDMSLYDGLEERIALENCDVLLLPCNGRDEERTKAGIIGNTSAEEASAFAAALSVPFIPAHHDLYIQNGRDTQEIIAAARDAQAEIIVLKPGESVVLPELDEDEEEY